MAEVSLTLKISGKEIKASTGKIANQAPGSIMLQMGGTTLFATVGIDAGDTDGDFFPLTIEYIEKMYARGAISGSRYQKRESNPTDEAIIKARQVDHSIRSLFPKSFKRPTTIILTVLTYDGINDPEALAVLGASMALMQSGIPFMGPSASVVACINHDGSILINPEVEGREELLAEMVVSGVTGKVLNMEGWAKEVSDEHMDKLLDESMDYIKKLNDFQIEFVKKCGQKVFKSDREYDDVPAPHDLVDIVKKEKYEEIKKALYTGIKDEQNEGLALAKKEITEKYATEETGYSEGDIYNAVEYIARKILREGVLSEDKRVSGRKLDEIRELGAEVDVLPTVHGSAIFNRGQTQSLSIVTLAGIGAAQIMDEMEGEHEKFFMHHYNMPPYANGEAGRFNYRPGRREVGHGAIGENALKFMVPSTDKFPYTIRVVSEITSSNGSTSMAATCASSLALMAAGVPLKQAVAGIGVGLITEDGNEENYKLLLDIEGIEDFYGDMDFKVCGTKNGITAMQYENKLRGVKPEILKQAFRLANKGRMQVLDVMNKTLDEPRTNVADSAPKVETLKIEVDRIGEFIGPGGKNIKALVAEAEEISKKPVDINVDEQGNIFVTTSDGKQMDFVKSRINGMFKVAEVGDVYDAVVDKIMNFGFFAYVPGTSINGLCHISEVTEKFLSDVSLVVKEGDEVKVKVIRTEDGKVSFSMKGLDQSAEIKSRIEKIVSNNKQ